MFYREEGLADAPAVVLLHGFPASSFMLPAAEFGYTFDALTADLLAQLGVTRYAMYVHDYGAPIGWRLAPASPDAVSAIITQNGNGYGAGFGSTSPACPMRAWSARTPGITTTTWCPGPATTWSSWPIRRLLERTRP